MVSLLSDGCLRQTWIPDNQAFPGLYFNTYFMQKIKSLQSMCIYGGPHNFPSCRTSVTRNQLLDVKWHESSRISTGEIRK